MSIVALKKKYLESKNLSHNKQFSLNSRQSLKYCRFNMGSFSQTSVKSSSYIHNRKKQWKSLMVNSLPENFNGDPSAFKYICNNWVQTTGADENYIENKAITAICDNSNNALLESNYCNISKKIGTEPSYISKKVKTLECSKNGFNRPFPYNVSSSKPSFISCKDKPVQQIYNAHEYYGFNENYYAETTIVDVENKDIYRNYNVNDVDNNGDSVTDNSVVDNTGDVVGNTGDVADNTGDVADNTIADNTDDTVADNTDDTVADNTGDTVADNTGNTIADNTGDVADNSVADNSVADNTDDVDNTNDVDNTIADNTDDADNIVIDLGITPLNNN